MSDVDELELVRLCKNNCRDSLTRLIDVYKPSMLKVIHWLAIEQQDRSDACQEAVLALMSAVREFDPNKGEFHKFAMTCVANRLIECGRGWHRTQHKVGYNINYFEYEPTEPAVLDLHEALEKAKPELRQLVLEHYGVGGPSLNLVQLSARHGLSEAKVKKSLQEAFKQMRGEA